MSDCEYEEIFLPIGISLPEADIIVGQWLRWHITKWTDNVAHYEKNPNTNPDDIESCYEELGLFKHMLAWLDV